MVAIPYKQPFRKDFFENQAWQTGQVVCGIDEVGRGCLAGPVVTAAVMLFPGGKNSLLKDSKLLDANQLQKAYTWIAKRAWYTYALADNRDIDQYNIYQASMRAMRRSLVQLLAQGGVQRPQKVLVDAMPLDVGMAAYQDIETLYFSQGEQKSSSIAAASIVAKVTRDAIMHRMSTLFPRYDFARHKGYCTKVHQEAVRKNGHSLVHRMGFLGNKAWLVDQQLGLPFE